METYWKPIGNQHAWLKTHQRLWLDLLETEVLDHRPVRDQHVCGEPSKIYMPAESNWNINNKYTISTLMRHVGLWWTLDYAWWSPMCPQLGMNVGLLSGMPVSDQACQSLMGHWSGISISDWACTSLMGLRWRITRSPMGSRSGMSVSDGSLIGLC